MSEASTDQPESPVKKSPGFMGSGLPCKDGSPWSVVSKDYFFPSGIKPAQPTSASGYTVPDVVSATLIDALRAWAVVM